MSRIFIALGTQTYKQLCVFKPFARSLINEVKASGKMRSYGASMHTASRILTRLFFHSTMNLDLSYLGSDPETKIALDSNISCFLHVRSVIGRDEMRSLFYDSIKHLSISSLLINRDTQIQRLHNFICSPHFCFKHLEQYSGLKVECHVDPNPYIQDMYEELMEIFNIEKEKAKEKRRIEYAENKKKMKEG